MSLQNLFSRNTEALLQLSALSSTLHEPSSVLQQMSWSMIDPPSSLHSDRFSTLIVIADPIGNAPK